MGGDFEMIFAISGESIFFTIPEEESAKSARKVPQIFYPTLRIGSTTQQAFRSFLNSLSVELDVPTGLAHQKRKK